MAIDTAERRKSVSGVWIPLVPGVTPNSAKDQEWRQESNWSYSGILASTVVAGPPVEPIGVAVLDPVLVRGRGRVDSVPIGGQGRVDVVLPLGVGRVDKA